MTKLWQSAYLAGPIDFSPDCPNGWREYAATRLREHGIISFNPFKAFHPAPIPPDPSTAAFVRVVNDFALTSSSGMLLKAEPSLGSGREFELCRRNRIPVVAFGEKALLSYTLLSYDLITFFGSIEDALDHITGV